MNLTNYSYLEALTDAELLREWKAGSDRTFEILYKRYLSQLLVFARRKLEDKELADDLVQETFIAFYWRKDSLAADVNVPAYLHTALKNKICNAYRSLLNREKHLQLHRLGLSERDNETQQQLEARELEARLNREAERLPEQCKAVFYLSRREYLSNKEIAARLEISVNTVEQHMRRALRQMRQVIELSVFPASLFFSFFSVWL